MGRNKRNHRLLTAFVIAATMALAPCAWAAKRIGVYAKTFDPVLINDIENAKRAKEAHRLDEVVFVPAESETAAIGIDDRLLLIRESTHGEHGLRPISLNALASRESIRAWLEELAGKNGKIIELIEGKNIPGQRMSEAEFRKNPLLGEAMLPESAAKLVKQRGWYGRGEERGFYDLPRGIVEWLNNEQRLNDRIENVDVFDSVKETTLEPVYSPENRPTFWIYTVEVPESEGFRIFTTKKRVPAGILLARDGKRVFRFFVHPASKKYFEKFLRGYAWKREYLATPTASHRSLLVWNPLTDDSPIAIKVSLDAEIGGSNRLLSRSQIERAVIMSTLINAIPENELEAQGIRFLDEPASAILDAADAGTAVRALPRTLLEGDRSVKLIPMFSVYSKPPGKEPSIVQSIRASGLPPREFLERFLIASLVRQHAWLAFHHGLSAEPHEQNVMIELKDGKPTGVFYYRDLGGFHLIPGLRVAAGKPLPLLPSGFDPGSLKLERANYVVHAYDYLLHSNLHAMTESTRRYFPEITRAWTTKTFLKCISDAVRGYTGSVAVTEASLKAAVTRYMKKFETKTRFECGKFLRKRGIQ
ncbi:MAG: hypothetical protein HYW49_03100 [Deltaproteobacteria bacterium]|nr:hypothetical protein [Deltaproteobacteria bacterium]